MKYVLSISAALLLAACQSQAPSPQQTNKLVSDAVNALGGADALRNLKAISITGEAKYWEPGQSKVAGKDPKHVEDVKFTVTRDLAGGRARTQWDRDHKYPEPALIIKYTETVLPNGAFVTDDKGANTAMASVRMAAAQRELNRASPTLLLKAMENPRDVRPIGNQRIGRQSYRAVSFNDGSVSYIILFDAATKLPAAIRTLDDDSVHGDQPYDAVLSNWKAVGGVQVAHALSYRIGGVEVGKVTYSQIAANPTIAGEAFTVPDALSYDLKATATGNVTNPWINQRM